MDEQGDWLSEAMAQVARAARAAELRDPRHTLVPFLTVLDSLERLITIAATEADVSGAPRWLDQLQIIHRQLVGAFERAGVSFFNCRGEPYDPARHEVVEVVSRPDLADETVVEELARGCSWQGATLRLAQVSVNSVGSRH